MKYICIHAHCYQPPRENPSLEAIEVQDSAYPYHDWNERITAECYAPNAASRILDGDNRITQIVNNYTQISFNFGPTLLSWMQEKAPKVYRAILDADSESGRLFGGHGSAIAQAYNHIIMPLANGHDKLTQIIWGLKDFEHRFHRPAEGMWLPETAVDNETLDLMAQQGIKFTILAPRQARRVRNLGGRAWKDVSGENIDPHMPYQVRLPSRRKITAFFYDGPISRGIAFEGLLHNGDRFASRLTGAFSPDEQTRPQLVHVATDGETYGHHHRYGEMALAYALHHIKSNKLAQITNYAEHLERFPPTHEVEIFENSSWSCVHGIERWRSDCGCNTGGHSGWNQAWRAPLREALDWLRDTLSPKYEEKARTLLKDPWAARDDYIRVILDHSPEKMKYFLEAHALRELTESEAITVWLLLEIQRHAMLMYTSCGWFFDELSGIESVQVLHYAGRAVHLAQQVLGDQMEATFLEKLKKAECNVAEHRDGAHIYEKFVKPRVVDLPKVCAHYAISSIFESYGEQTRIYCYRVERDEYTKLETGKMKLAIGRARFSSEITQESAKLAFGVLHFGDHNLTGGVCESPSREVYDSLTKGLAEAFSKADVPEVIRLLDKHFGKNLYSLRSLFRDEQQRIVNSILGTTLAEAEAAYGQIYDQHAPLLRFLSDLSIPIPKPFHPAAEFALNSQLRKTFVQEELDLERIHGLLENARSADVALDSEMLEFTLRKRIEQIMEEVRANPADLKAIEKLEAAVALTRSLPFPVDLWEVQNMFFQDIERTYGAVRPRAEQGDEDSRAWLAHFTSLADHLSLRLTGRATSAARQGGEG